MDLYFQLPLASLVILPLSRVLGSIRNWNSEALAVVGL